jgi:hypothetical protein
MVLIAVVFFVVAAVLLVTTLIGPERFFEREMRQYRDPEAAARALRPSDEQFLARRIGTAVGAVVMVLGGCYALSLADDYDDGAGGPSTDQVRVADERVT